MIKFSRNPITAALAVLLTAGLISCTSSEAGEGSGRENVPIETKEAMPGVGVGRDMTVVHEDKTYTVCIDPGHGFMDGGTGENYFGDGILEKDITLAVAEKLNEKLTEYGFVTIMTHDGVTFPTTSVDDGNDKFKPSERVAYANSLDIDYYVSIHVNSFDADRSISGMRIYYEQNWRKKDTYSEAAAREIASALYNEMPDMPEPIIADQTSVSYEVVRETTVAASLIELGFCTNKTDAANMLNSEWQDRAAQAIADGILNFYTKNIDGDDADA